MKRTWMRRRSTKQAAFESAYAALRPTILERDAFRCRRCGAPRSMKPLEVHHVVKRSQAKAKRLDVDNLVTLCGNLPGAPGCHAWTDEPYEGKRGRLVVVPLGGGEFSMRVMRGSKHEPVPA